ncbi:MAG: ribosome biogenesis GTPase Der [Kiritimatiellia bacterium]|jgi:GTP-binding protein
MDAETDIPTLPEPSARRRVVAIVGRPNVGKSALFNRIAGRRIAVVHNEAGVTRDRQQREVSWDGQRFSLIDTGGLSIIDSDTRDGSDPIEAGIRAQVAAALSDAAAVILVVDSQVGLHPLDQEAARRIHASGIPAFVAVNKCDLPRHETAEADFAGLGFPLFPVSALHDRGVGALVEQVLAVLPDTREETIANPLRVAIVGRPNAGKSSFVNRLLRNDRIIVSEIAGTTRDSIEAPFTIGSGPHARHYVLIDTAGMRHLRDMKDPVERYSLLRAEQSVDECDVAVLVMDAQIGPTLQDKRIAARILEAKKGCVLVMNKWDKCREEGMTETKSEPVLRKAMPFLRHCPVVFVSALDGYNVRRTIDAIDHVAAQTRLRLPTGMLNRAIAEAMEFRKPPATGGRPLRLFYATQTGVAPVSIRIFVNDPDLVTRPYREYLLRQLRERFGLEGATVVFEFRERTRPVGRAGATPSEQASTPGEPAEKRHAAKGRKTSAPKPAAKARKTSVRRASAKAKSRSARARR